MGNCKFNEQMLVVMLMYTREKGIEYFSFNDIVSVFKTKFKIPATDRKVRYAFDTGGTMFDKKVKKKIAYHKLMNSGIKEAERIIAEQKADTEVEFSISKSSARLRNLAELLLSKRQIIA